MNVFPPSVPIRLLAAVLVLLIPPLLNAQAGSGTIEGRIFNAATGAALANARAQVRPGAPVLIVVNDRRDLYPSILERAGLRLEERLRRHVNRRTGRRAGEFFEDVLVARA